MPEGNYARMNLEEVLKSQALWEQDLADLMHAKIWSERQFWWTCGCILRGPRQQINRIEDAVDALEVTGRARGGHLRPGCSWPRRLQFERDETECLGLRAA